MEQTQPSRGMAQASLAPMKFAKSTDHGNRITGQLNRGAKGMEQTTTVATPKLKIVIVEDDPTIRMFLKSSLEEQLGHQVIGEAGTGTDMVRTVLDLEPDVVVFDIHLPRLNGLDALRQIYQERVIAAVAITADRDQDLVRRALEEHVLAFLVKPVEAHQLGAAVLVAWARFEELKQLTDENATLRNSLQNRKIIERAKGVLMKRHRWSEAEAFRRLQRASMNNRTTMIDLAQAVLNGKEVEL
jgi:two-component system, response regulator PdtaR